MRSSCVIVARTVDVRCFAWWLLIGAPGSDNCLRHHLAHGREELHLVRRDWVIIRMAGEQHAKWRGLAGERNHHDSPQPVLLKDSLYRRLIQERLGDADHLCLATVRTLWSNAKSLPVAAGASRAGGLSSCTLANWCRVAAPGCSRPITRRSLGMSCGSSRLSTCIRSSATTRSVDCPCDPVDHGQRIHLLFYRLFPLGAVGTIAHDQQRTSAHVVDIQWAQPQLDTA